MLYYLTFTSTIVEREDKNYVYYQIIKEENYGC